jgi:hypothetical protein
MEALPKCHESITRVSPVYCQSINKVSPSYNQSICKVFSKYHNHSNVSLKYHESIAKLTSYWVVFCVPVCRGPKPSLLFVISCGVVPFHSVKFSAFNPFVESAELNWQHSRIHRNVLCSKSNRNVPFLTNRTTAPTRAKLRLSILVCFIPRRSPI